MKIQAPITVEMKVSITNGKRRGTATVGLGNGRYPTEAEMRDGIAKLISGGSLPDGYRLMTKREWWDTFCMDEAGQIFAMPGGPEFDSEV
jgi:hypothetical protein